MSVSRVMSHEIPVWGDRSDYEIDVQVPGDEETLERLAVRRLSVAEFEICCLPFALYDVGLGDTIRVEGLTTGSPGRVTERLRDAGHFLFRVALSEPGRHQMQSAASTFLSMGYLVEVHSDTLLALDAEDATSAQLLADYLQLREDAGDWEYESGRQ